MKVARDMSSPSPQGNDLAFLAGTGDGRVIHTTVTARRDGETRQWRTDGRQDGDRTPFTPVSLPQQ